MASTAFRSIAIEGFKSIRVIKDLELRPINLLIGSNGSGKSNFLEAFIFLGAALLGEMDSYIAYQGGANKLLHFGSKSTKRILVSIERGNAQSVFAHYGLAGNDTLAGATGGGGLLPDDSERWSFSRYRFQDTGDDSGLRRTNEVHDNRWLRRKGGNLWAFLYRIKQQFSSSFEIIRRTVQLAAPFFEDFVLEPLALNPDTIKLEWKHAGSDEYFDVSSLSDGTIRFIALATLFLQPVELRPAVILIDEPELGLHPRAIELLASMIKQASRDTQVIAATQSSLLIDFFEPEDILVADRLGGATEMRRLERRPLDEWMKEYSLGQLWEKGELQGTPVRE
jgi:predicted ATPase